MLQRKGQVVIEMVMVIVVFILLLALMLSMFQLMHNKIITSYAAYIGAREYSYYNPEIGGDGHDKKSAEKKARETLALFVNPQDLKNFTINIKSEDGKQGVKYAICTVEGKINYIWNWGNPLGGKKIKTTIQIIQEQPLNEQKLVGELNK